MQPLYTEAEFQTAKSRQPLPLRCLHCNQTFYKDKNDILSTIAKVGNFKSLFCSTTCRQQHSITSIQIDCQQCSKPFKKQKRQIEKSKHNFCCQSCAATYGNAHKKHGTRCSKLEKWLQEQLLLLYPSIEFHFNQTDAINGELDIFIPSLKLAFELNGIFHYEPIYGPEKLSKTQTNDHRKMIACAEHGIELCVMDVYHFKYFKEP